MVQTYRNLRQAIMLLFALACGAMAILWPQWKEELRAQGYYDCSSPNISCDPESNPETCKPLPQYFNWKDNVSLPDPKDQGLCGSCWAFSAAGAVECTRAVKSYTYISLSEQHLVSDCGCPGSCYGGYNGNALIFIKSRGTVYKDCFPYKSANCIISGACTQSCNCSPNCSNPCFCNISNECLVNKIYISDYKPVSNNIDDIKRALLCYGPLSISIWGGGHAVVLVGYDDNIGEWIFRNSYGPDWPYYGAGGYGRTEFSDIGDAYYVIP
jgi:cysteine peptidase B